MNVGEAPSLALAVAFFAAALLPLFFSTWDLAGFDYFSNATELRLYERDYLLYEGQPLCFRYAAETDGSILVNGTSASVVSANPVCIDVPYGALNISVSSGGRSVWFLTEKRFENPPEASDSAVQVTVQPEARQYERVPVRITATNGMNKGRVSYVSLLADNETVREMPLELMPGETRTVTEHIRIRHAGTNIITARLDTGESGEGATSAEPRFSFPLLALLLAVPGLLLFRKHENNALHIIAFSAACLVIASSLAGLADLTYVVPVLVIMALAALLFSNRFAAQKPLTRIDYRFLFIMLAVVLALAAVPSLFFPSGITPWNVYYERQADETFYEHKVPVYDPLSYGGRPLSFPHGYFASKAAFFWLTGLEPGTLATSLFGLLANALLVCSMAYFTGVLGLRHAARAVFILSFVMVFFVFVLLAANLMHVLSLALLFFSLAYAVQRQHLLSGIMLGASAMVHPFSLVLFLLFAAGLRFYRQETVDRTVAVPFLLGSGLFGALYAPTLIAVGMPYENAPQEWGYLVHWGISSLFGELAFSLPLVLLAAWFSRNNRKLFALFAALLVLYMTVSFRLNVALAFTGSLLLAQWASENRRIVPVVIIMLLLSMIPFLYTMTGFKRPCDDVFLTGECLGAMEYLSMHSGSSTVLAPLRYGHAITGLAGLKVVADPYVEYSDNARLTDVLRFESERNLSIAEKWGADIVVAEHYGCDRDLVYDNGHVRICWRGYS
ncbi:MAG: hypothetical protein HYY37_02440 [Candidatus Aenigmarchaeota archaeon]|nr:hypothetical protein [Candidatus Aenigmarchaeota archaeon]